MVKWYLEIDSDDGFTVNTMKVLTIEAKINNLSRVLAFIDVELLRAGCRPKPKMQLDIATEELFINIARYAYVPDTGDVTISIAICDDPAVAEITFADSGIPFNPFAKPDPDITLKAEDRSIGGLGVFMVKKAMDEVDYEYRDGLNLTTIRKKIK
jgi:anti-sigma regulatory factor (Ser/Thr protein kinase)